ncbi:MAG: TIGR03086 family metal-binding protein [Planctomycetia bacterium]
MLERLLEGFDRRVRATPHDKWSSPTPCEGWSARDLVAHVASNMSGLAAALTGSAPAAFDPDDVAGSWATAHAAIVDALRNGDLTTKVPGPIGLMPAHAVIDNLLSIDVLVHTWDLARAVGGDEALDSDDVARAYAVMQPMDAVIRAPGVFGPKVPVPEGADAQTELLHFLGRQT